jgi:PAS domain S-box-containing protein
MKAQKTTRLSIKLLTIIALIVGTTLVGLFALLESREYFSERDELVANLQELLKVQNAPIASALWELDVEKINLFLVGIGNLPFVQGSFVTDKLGNVVASNGDIETLPDVSEFVGEEQLTFKTASNLQILGSFQIIAHDRELVQNLTRRLGNDAIILFVVLLVLVGATYIAINLLVEKPLNLLQASIEKLRREGARERVDWATSDELGKVVRAYNEIQSAQERTEDELRCARDTLELRVAERSKDLVHARDRAIAAEKNIAESEEQIKSILDSAPIGWTIGRADGTFLETNDQLCEFFGRSRADFLNTSAEELFKDPTDRQSVMDQVRKDGSMRDRELAFKKADGTTIWALLSMQQTHYKGEPVVLGWSYDITERKRAEEERLIQSQKMDALGQLTSSVAHDFNNVLTVLDCNIGLMKEQGSNQEQQQTLVSNSLDAVELGKNLTAHLVSIARKEPSATKIIDLNSLISEFSDLLGRSLGGEVSFKYTLSDDNLLVFIDPARFEIALLNLTVNARDAMPMGGVITVSLMKVNIDKRTKSDYGSVEKRSYALLRVSDTGIGIPPKIRRRILEIFFTTKKHGEGTGLGLQSVLDLVESCDGFLQVKSKPGKGTTMKVFIPLVIEETPS